MNELNINPNLLAVTERDSYLTKWNSTPIKIDATKWVYPLIPLDVIREANIKAVKKVVDNLGFEYMDLSPDWLYHSFKEEIWNRYAEFSIKPENIILGHWSFNIIERILTKVLKNGTTLLGVWPQFNELPWEFSRWEWNNYITAASEISKTPDLESVLEILSQEKNISAVYLDNPNNPTWKELDLNLLESVIIASQEKWILVIADEAYWDFLSNSESAISLVGKCNNLIVVKSMSKWYWLARDRIGYAIWQEELVNILSQVFVPFEPSEKPLEIWTQIMADYPLLSTTNLAEKKWYMMDNIQNHTDIEIEDTNMNVPIMLMHTKDIVNRLLKIGIKTVPWSAFSNTSPYMSDDFCRIVVPHNNDKFEQVINLILKK